MTNIDRLELSGESGRLNLGPGVLLPPRQRIIGIGKDRKDVGRIWADIQEYPYFVTDNFRVEEISYCEQVKRSFYKAQRYAAKFAGKEAVSKALGEVADPSVSLHDIAILKKASGLPYVVLFGNALRHSQMLGVSEIFISLSHERDSAEAFCVAVGMEQAPARC